MLFIVEWTSAAMYTLRPFGLIISQDLRKKCFGPKMCFIYLEKFFAPANISKLRSGYVKIHMWSAHYICQLFTTIRNMLTYLIKTVRYYILWKSFQGFSSCFRHINRQTDGRADGRNDYNRRFAGLRKRLERKSNHNVSLRTCYVSINVSGCPITPHWATSVINHLIEHICFSLNGFRINLSVAHYFLNWESPPVDPLPQFTIWR
jgi:hypothetical protein